MKLEITNTELAVILEALGKEKNYLNAKSMHDSAHAISDLQKKIKEGK